MPEQSPKRRKAARPAEILDAALEEFAERGFAAATPASIARRAGIARATIYLYFDGKDAIFEALLRDRLLAPLVSAGAAPPDPDASSEEILIGLFRRFYDDVLGGGAPVLMRVIVAEGHRFPGIVRAHHDLVARTGLALIRGIVERGVARGEFASDAAEIDMRVLLAPALMAALWEMIFASIEPLDREAVLRSHVRLALEGLRPRGGS